jgi:hypothetical protein
MNTRHFALIFGIVFAAVGVIGFIPGLLTPPGAEEPALAVEASRGRLLGLFPVNVLHNAVHLAFGIWGIVAYRSLGAARLYARSVAVIYAVLVVMGLIPVLNTTFGLIPLYGHNIWLHAALALIAAYFGFRSEPETVAAAR